MSSLDWSCILRGERPPEFRLEAPRVEVPRVEAPRIRLMRSDRPRRPSSSAITRRALSEAMKLTVWTRRSRSTARRKCRRKMAPLAPVVATVRFCGGWLGKLSPGLTSGADLGRARFQPCRYQRLEVEGFSP